MRGFYKFLIQSRERGMYKQSFKFTLIRLQYVVALKFRLVILFYFVLLYFLFGNLGEIKVKKRSDLKSYLISHVYQSECKVNFMVLVFFDLLKKINMHFESYKISRAGDKGLILAFSDLFFLHRYFSWAGLLFSSFFNFFLVQAKLKVYFFSNREYINKNSFFLFNNGIK